MFSLIALLYLDESMPEKAIGYIKSMGERIRSIQTKRWPDWQSSAYVPKETLLEAYYFTVARYSDFVKNYKTAAKYYTKTIVRSLKNTTYRPSLENTIRLSRRNLCSGSSNFFKCIMFPL